MNNDSFSKMVDMMAANALKVFGSDARLFYVPRVLPEKRKTEERFEFKAIEMEISVESIDGAGYVMRKKGKGFSVQREEIDRLNAFRNEMWPPFPAGRDFIVVVRGEEEERFEIVEKIPYELIGPNKTLYQINTVKYA